MRYMLLLHHPEAALSPPGTEAFAAGVAEFDAFHAELARRGIAWDGHPLQPTATATAVRVRDGRTLVTDGPFAETREQLGGFYVLDLPDLDAAIEVAALVPWAKGGTVEVRPVADLAAPEQVVPATA
jgi:hypothetical protein